jgi:hypothetical protein
VALFVRGGAHVTSIGFVEFTSSPKAGHATQPQCSAAVGCSASLPTFSRLKVIAMEPRDCE